MNRNRARSGLQVVSLDMFPVNFFEPWPRAASAFLLGALLVPGLRAQTAPAGPTLPAPPGARVIRLNPTPGNFSEPSIALNRADPQQLVAAFQVNASAAYSRDAGNTWTTGSRRRFAKARQQSIATRSPVRVAQLALPALTRIAPATPPEIRRWRRESFTGAACTRFWVNTAAAEAGAPVAIRPRSSFGWLFSTRRMPAYSDENR